MGSPHSNLIILFDGVCNFCNAWVDFVLRQAPTKRFRFAALQSVAGRSLLARHGRATDDLDTMLLLEGAACYSKSTAVLRITRRLGGLWPMMYAFIAVPRPIRDVLYTVIAKRRYRWFGKRSACRVPTAEERDRFIMDSEGEER